METALKILVGLVLVLLLAICVSDIFSSIAFSEKYRFGTEVAGWSYYSKANFISSNLLVSALSLMGLYSFRSKKNSTGVTIGGLAIILFMIL